MRKFTLEESQEIFNHFGLTILDTEAKGIEKRYKCIDKNGYLYAKSTHALQTAIKRNYDTTHHLFSSKNPYFYENMIHYIEKEVTTGTVMLTSQKDVKNADQVIIFKCGECGREFGCTWRSFVSRQEKICTFCFNRKRLNGEVDNKHKDSNLFHLKAKELGIIILSGPNVYYKSKLLVQDKEGYRGLIHASSIMRGSNFDKFGVKNPYTIDNLRIFAFKHGWDCVIYDQEYKGDKIPLKIMCSCGNDFLVDCNHFIAGKYQCNECRVKQSAIAKTIELWLQEQKIFYEKEKKFKGCKNKKLLPFDFYLIDFNICIEVDGIGHYRPVAFGGNKEKAEQIFQERQINDNIKTKYCQQNNIQLIRIPFWEIEGEGTFKNWLKATILSNKSNDLDK